MKAFLCIFAALCSFQAIYGAEEQGLCARELALLEQQAPVIGRFRPACEEDGSYSPRQCRGSVCMCVDSHGKSTGHEANIGRASEMNCLCARRKADNNGMVGQTHSCDELGNFNPVQCVGSMCHCVSKEGAPDNHLPVHVSQIKTLHCYKEPVEEPAKLGPCHAELQALKEQPPVLGRHKPQCLEDGTYHPRQCRGSVCTCVDTQGVETDYKANIGSAKDMGCQCARDLADYMKTGLIGKLFHCDELGNYKDQKPPVVQPKGKCDAALQKVQPGLLGVKIPQCLPDGSFRPKQCHEAICECVDEDGEPTGHKALVHRATHMNCQCAHDMANYMKNGLLGKMFSCDKLGNYNPVQCTGSVCHCVDEKGIMLQNSPTAHIAQMDELEC